MVALKMCGELAIAVTTDLFLPLVHWFGKVRKVPAIVVLGWRRDSGFGGHKMGRSCSQWKMWVDREIRLDTL